MGHPKEETCDPESLTPRDFELESFKNREILGFTIEIHGKNRDF